MSDIGSDVEQTAEEFEQQLRVRNVQNTKRNNRALKRKFVVLRARDMRFCAVPRRSRMSDLNNAGRVQDIHFTQNDSSEAMLALIIATFPFLRMESNLPARLEFFKSIDRGNDREMVFEGEVPNGYNLKNAFKTGKVFIHLKPNFENTIREFHPTNDLTPVSVPSESDDDQSDTETDHNGQGISSVIVFERTR
ncbi:uncharacterized protein LOC116292539 [Actinia tenebrosa]|uniref:Uncharacterized protein LOC116292539 n=1 Tax=Actinia tenebrosa TaxID=6105 RepID=A0A6P8HIR5_ACTTE|nr:uncharacterized protein LOC116292539 [Actinia tenebrosa]